MKKKPILIVAMLCLLSIGAALQTYRYGWTSEYSSVSTDDTLVSADPETMTFSDIPSTRVYRPSPNQNGIEVSWTMGADAQSCVVYLYAARRSGDIALAWTATLTAGKQVSTGSRYYVDTIASATDTWILPILLIDYSGNDRQARIVLDTCGYSYFFCQYTGLSSESIQVAYSGF